MTNNFETRFGIRPWLAAVLLGAFVAACGGGGAGRDPILGFDGSTPLPPAPPTVTAVAPLNNSTGVPINSANITAAFSEAVAPLTAGGFTLTCAAP